jgi:hypothetical protein
MDGPVKTVFYHMMSRVPHTLLTHYYSLCMSGNCFYLFDTCRTSRPIHTCTQYVCLRASQFESESKTRAADQYVCLRASQFESESKTRAADQYVCLRASQSESESKTRAADQTSMYVWMDLVTTELCLSLAYYCPPAVGAHDNGGDSVTKVPHRLVIYAK